MQSPSTDIIKIAVNFQHLLPLGLMDPVEGEKKKDTMSP